MRVNRKFSSSYRAGMMLAAFALDRLIGDPERPTHPARLLGETIALADRGLLPRLKSPLSRRIGGVGLALALPAATFLGVSRLLRSLPTTWSMLVEVWLLGTALAGRDLGEAASRVQRGLTVSLDEGRRQVAWIVGRDTTEMTEAEVVRATVETVAENTSDGVVSPLLFGFIGGAPLALAFKAISTLDSMVGYRNERYSDFGWASARLDDLVNYVPARVTALAASLVGGLGRKGMRSLWRDRVHHASPNAGLVEASFAQALRVRLGGTARYGGIEMRRAQVGGDYDPPGLADIDRTVALSEAVGLVVLGAGAGALWGWGVSDTEHGNA